MKTKILYVLGLLLLVNLAFADVLEFTNGKTLEGKFIGRTNGMVQFEANGITGNYSDKDVKNISLGSSKKNTASKSPAKQASKGPVTIVAGTILQVRTTESVTSKHKAGHKFKAVLEADLVSNGVVAAKKGTTVYGQLVSSKQARRMVGKSELTLTFTGILINSQIKPIQSGSVKAVAESGSGRETVGRTARAAAIGHLADGSEGAKTGAKIGLGVSLLTRGRSINIPSGTLLDVPLAAGLTI